MYPAILLSADVDTRPKAELYVWSGLRGHFSRNITYSIVQFAGPFLFGALGATLKNEISFEATLLRAPDLRILMLFLRIYSSAHPFIGPQAT